MKTRSAEQGQFATRVDHRDTADIFKARGTMPQTQLKIAAATLKSMVPSEAVANNYAG